MIPQHSTAAQYGTDWLFYWHFFEFKQAMALLRALPRLLPNVRDAR